MATHLFHRELRNFQESSLGSPMRAQAATLDWGATWLLVKSGALERIKKHTYACVGQPEISRHMTTD